MDTLDTSMIDWARAQFALTAMYHWVFVPLTLGLAVVMGIMETLYYKTGNEFWKRSAKFWMKLFGINFAVGVATGLILEFQFGTNWSNYSWFVGDIFGAPLAIEGIVAFFMEATFIAVMFFGWNKVGKGFHLASTWLTGLGATISAWWILVANAWMQHPVGMEFNPDTMRNEMVSFVDVALSPMAVHKFFHTVLSGWTVGAAFVVGIACWFLLKGREKKFALHSIKIGAIFGLVSTVLLAITGDQAGYMIAKYQPMKLAAVEAQYDGEKAAGLSIIGMLNPSKDSYNDNEDPFIFNIKFPYLLSFLATRDVDGFVPGIKNIIDGGYTLPDGTTALSAQEKMQRGKVAVEALATYRKAKANKDEATAQPALATLKANMPYFGYGYIKNAEELIPNVTLNYYCFRLMVGLGVYFIIFFIAILVLAKKEKFLKLKWMHWVALITIPLAYLAGQCGWAVAELGRQPWTIQDLLPVSAAVSNVQAGSVMTTFFIFLALFTIMLIAEVGIMLREIKKGPEGAADK